MAQLQSSLLLPSKCLAGHAGNLYLLLHFQGSARIQIKVEEAGNPVEILVGDWNPDVTGVTGVCFRVDLISFYRFFVLGVFFSKILNFFHPEAWGDYILFLIIFDSC